MAVLLAVSVALIAGCGSARDHAAEVAAAKCSHAIHEALRLSNFDTSLRLQDVEVTKLSPDSRRVEGFFTHSDAAGRTFVCEVVPDANDKLRGLRVTRLELSPVA